VAAALNLVVPLQDTASTLNIRFTSVNIELDKQNAAPHHAVLYSRGYGILSSTMFSCLKVPQLSQNDIHNETKSR
jgi:hypothetical protein